MKLSKEEAVDIAIRCGSEYKNKLCNTRVLIIYRDRTSNELMHLELLFFPSNYQHLTGLIMIDDKGLPKDGYAREFYHKCVSVPHLTPKEIVFKEDGTTPLKLASLSALMDLTKITKICGDYNSSKKNIQADALVGGVNFSLALSKYADTENEFFPRSALLEDIRNLVVNPSQVLAILQKPINSKEKYESIKYVAKGVNLKHINFPDSISSLIKLI